jgi:predicted Rossmann-fold nucleotide-binding protein
LGFQSKPIGFLNVEGYYNKLFDFLGSIASQGFVKPGLVEALAVESDPEKLIDRLISHPWPNLGSWPKIS